MSQKKYGGEDFGITLEKLKKLAPLAETIGNVEFNGPARKVSAILTMASVGGELIAEIERLAIFEVRCNAIDSMRIMLTPEYGAGYAAVVYGDQTEAISQHFGLTAIEAIDEALKPERVLAEDAQADRDSFEANYGSGNCSCHLSPPCSSCTHPGNPLNQEDDESCWTVQP